MTTSKRMSNFRLMAERFSQGEKLMTTQEKQAVMSHQVCEGEPVASESSIVRFPRVRLVLRPGKKHVPH